MSVTYEMTSELHEALENLIDYILQWNGSEFGESKPPTRKEAEIIAAQFINARCFNVAYENDNEVIATALAELRKSSEERAKVNAMSVCFAMRTDNN